jgi:hypothetical protein
LPGRGLAAGGWRTVLKSCGPHSFTSKIQASKLTF